MFKWTVRESRGGQVAGKVKRRPSPPGITKSRGIHTQGFAWVAIEVAILASSFAQSRSLCNVSPGEVTAQGGLLCRNPGKPTVCAQPNGGWGGLAFCYSMPRSLDEMGESD